MNRLQAVLMFCVLIALTTAEMAAAPKADEKAAATATTPFYPWAGMWMWPWMWAMWNPYMYWFPHMLMW